MTDSGKLALNKHIQWLYFNRELAQLGRTGGSFKKYYSTGNGIRYFAWRRESVYGIVI